MFKFVYAKTWRIDIYICNLAVPGVSLHSLAFPRTMSAPSKLAPARPDSADFWVMSRV